MKIALVSEHASPLATLGSVDAGGQNVHVAALASTLVEAGHTVTVYTRRDSPTTPRRTVMKPGLIVEQLTAGPMRPIPKDEIFIHLAGFTTELQQALARERPAIVHSHFWMSGISALAAARALELPVVHTFHALGAEKRRFQQAADTSPRTRLREEARIAQSMDRIIATASAEAFELVRMGARSRAIKIVPCGVDVSRFNPVGPQEPRGSNFRIVTLSRLVPRKGVDLAIEALAALPEAELIIAGGGERADLTSDEEVLRLRAVAQTHGVTDRVRFRGRVERDEAPALLRSADVVVCAPWYEPFGIVPLEAMASGVPVIAASVGGLVDTVVDGVTGLHVPPRNATALARALITLRDDPASARRMGAAGVERARSRYSWSRVADETAEVYARTIGAADAAELATGS